MKSGRLEGYRNRYPILSDEVFKATCNSVRVLGGLPVREALVAIAQSNARRASLSDPGPSWHPSQLSKMAIEVADRIIKSFDPEKFRPAPKTTRVQRAARNEKILDLYLKRQEQSGKKMTMTELAEASGLSRNQVNRILRSNGISPKQERAITTLSPHAQRLAWFGKRMLPTDGKIAFWRSELASLVTFGVRGHKCHPDDILRAAQELEAAKVGLHFFLPPGKHYGMMIRGRKFADGDASRWLIKQLADGNVAELPRLLNPVDQGEEAGDLAAVLGVSCGQQDEPTLRRFFIASIDVDDPVPYYRVIRYASKASGIDAVVDRLRAAGGTRMALEPILDELSYLIELSVRSADLSTSYVVKGWINASNYRTRLGKRTLWNRTELNLEVLIKMAEATDDPTEMLAALAPSTAPLP